MAILPRDLALIVRRALRAPGPVQVHDLRVAIRRFNQALALSSQNRNKTARSQSKRIMKRAGDVRNVDITIKLVARLKASKVLESRLKRRRIAAAKRLVEDLKSSTLPDRLPAGRPYSRQAAIRAITRLFKRGARADQPKDLHRVRIAAKKLRYTLEMVAPRHPRLEEIKRLQSDLGRINDYETAWTIVKRERGVKSLRDQLKDTQHKKVRAFRKRWTRILSDPAAARTWIREL
jgi:CHAD domain-containing protein